MIDQLVLETIQYACKSVRMDERAFVESIRSASEIREQSEAKKLKAALKHQEKRYAELDILLKKCMRTMPLADYLPISSQPHRNTGERFLPEKKRCGKDSRSGKRRMSFGSLLCFYSRLTDGMMCSACGEFLNNGCGTA